LRDLLPQRRNRRIDNGGAERCASKAAIDAFSFSTSSDIPAAWAAGRV
jgi:hypothetical protein